MAYNELLEQKIEACVDVKKLDKKKMFGGLGYLVNGNMCFGVYRDDLILRCEPEKGVDLLKNRNIRVFDITGKPMKGWLLIDPKEWNDKKKLKGLLDIGLKFAKGLPKK